jgi:hypothetical protein
MSRPGFIQSKMVRNLLGDYKLIRLLEGAKRFVVLTLVRRTSNQLLTNVLACIPIIE